MGFSGATVVDDAAPQERNDIAGAAIVFTSYRAPTKALAVFADGRLSLTDRLRVLAGIRYTDEKRGLFGVTTTFSIIASVPTCPPTIALLDPAYRFCLQGRATKVAFLTQSPYALLNAQLTYRSPDRQVTVTAWMRNITNRAVYNDARRYGSTNFAGGDIRPPRTFGASLKYSF